MNCNDYPMYGFADKTEVLDAARKYWNPDKTISGSMRGSLSSSENARGTCSRTSTENPSSTCT